MAREIQARELSRRIELDGPDDELKRLADTFDSMLARLDVAFASQRRFVADASHELRTPLAIIQANLELALTDAEGNAESRARGGARDQARDPPDGAADRRPARARAPRRAGRTAASRSRSLPLLEDAREEFAAAAADRGVELEAAAAPELAVSGDRDVLKRALANLLDNAVRVAPPGSSRPARARRAGRLGLARRRRRGAGDRARAPARRSSTASGDADDGRARPGGGSGLGLAIVRQIAEAHGGSVEVHSAAGRGRDVRPLAPAGGCRLAAGRAAAWRSRGYGVGCPKRETPILRLGGQHG